MPSKRNKTPRAAQLQSRAAPQSDYDTDTANLTDNQPHLAVVPPPPLRSTAELNHLVLRRHYPELEQILAIAPFAVLYNFNPDTQTWEKCDTEGTLFVCQLIPSASTAAPRYRIVILNRKNLDNFAYDLVSTEDVELTTEYVIVQLPAADGTPQVYGIWIFSDNDMVPDTREMVGDVVMECARRAEEWAMEPAAEVLGEEAGAAAYDFDGSANFAHSPYHSYGAPVQDQPPQDQPPQVYGQQIDLATLFTKPQAQGLAPPSASSAYQGGIPGFGQQAGFAPSADTGFFRGSHSPAHFQQ